MQTSDTDQLLLKYFTEQLSLEEQHILTKWRQSDSNNEIFFKTIQSYWEHYPDDLNKEMLEVRLRILHKIESGKTIHQKSKYFLFENKAFFKIAAAVAILIVLSIALFYQKALHPPVPAVAEVTWIEKVALPGQKISTVLPDGSHVKLNSGSKLIVPSKFEGDFRKIHLEGEAFFDIKPDDQHPFVISTNWISVSVLGTSFNVKAYSESATPVVSVKSGKVAVQGQAKTDKNPRVELLPDEMVTYIDQELIKTRIDPTEDPFSWTRQKLVFKDQELKDVLIVLERWYGVQIQIDSSITLDKKYTGNHENPTLVEVLDLLAFVYQINYNYDVENKKVRIF